MAVKWRVDEGLSVLIAQWKKEHPGAVVYTIGDASHLSHDSEHNPEPDGSAPGADAGEVDAADFMPGKGGVTMDTLRDLRNDLLEVRDARLFYMIIDKEIVSSVVSPWKVRHYGGKKHSHLHLSVNDRFKANIEPWDIDGKGDAVARTYTMRPVDGLLPELRVGDEDQAGKTGYIRRVQALLGVEQDGVYGPETARKLAARMAGQDSYEPSASNGGKLYEPEWRVLYGLWG